MATTPLPVPGLEWRIGRGPTRLGAWNIKHGQARWRIVNRVSTLSAAVEWFRTHRPDVDLATVAVLDSWPWLSLAEHMAEFEGKLH